MEARIMTRRFFVNKLVTWSKRVFIFCLLPFDVIFSAAFAGKKENAARVKLCLGLREIVLKKIHHGKNQFINPFNSKNSNNPWQVIQWKLFSKNSFKNFYEQERVTPVSIDWRTVKDKKGLSVTFIKHACVMIKDMDKYILVDPVFFGIPGFYKDFSPLASDIKEMPRPDHVLITHGHYDHLDKPSLASLGKNTHVITPLGYNEILDDLKMNRHTQMDWFDTFSEGKLEITLLPCNHWTMRNPFVGPNRSLWGSFLIKTASGFTIYISGDTGYFEGFREIGEEFSIDLAIFNLGAYEPRWFMADSHMNPHETVQAFQALRARHLFIVHWGTFRLGDEPVHFPPIDLNRELEKEGSLDRLIHLKHGQTLFYDDLITPKMVYAPE
jgi:L-ascorbate metabolism protein UlaG (beta-lactamase superfamily)